ncbi:hypothetical protein DL796_04935 [Kangiella spongicola]|uniref:Uncharacterized protein n=1 Tax=Kangiella spongicola TaxID=796379 RepID=A0A318DC17_9GAMM|nr:hypothetical protein DL796_04935 [Kangiella spongicola]
MFKIAKSDNLLVATFENPANKQFFKVGAFYSKLPTNNHFLQAWSDFFDNFMFCLALGGNPYFTFV